MASNPSRHFKIEELTPPGYRTWNVLDQDLVDLVDKLYELNALSGPLAVVRCNFAGSNHRGFREEESTVGSKTGAHRYGKAADLFFYDSQGKLKHPKGNVAAADAVRAQITQWKNQGLLPQLRWMEPGVSWIHVEVSRGSEATPDADPDLIIESPQTSPGNVELYIKKPVTVSSNDVLLGVAISNEIILTNYDNGPNSISFFTNLFKKAELTQEEIDKLLPALGLPTNKIGEYINSTSLQLTNDKCNNLLYSFIDANSSRLKSNFGLVLSEHPREVNSALVSFIFDMSFVTENSIKELANKITSYLITKKYDLIADLIETQGNGQLDNVKTKRINEAKLIRLRKSDIPNYTSSVDKIDTDTFFNGKNDGLNQEVSNSRDAINSLKNKKTSEAMANSSPGSRDEIYQEITREVANSFADLLEKQQIITDNYFNEKDSEYLIRLNIKNLYTNKTRNNNQSYLQVEKELEKSKILDEYYRLSSAYTLFPFGDGLCYTVKSNAINRCTYRIKKLKLELENIKSDLISLGVSNILTPLIGLPLRYIKYTDLIISKFVEYLRLSSKLENENKNISNLIKDLNHYNKKTINA